MPQFTRLPFTRREFLNQAGKGLGLIAFSQIAPSFVTQSLRANAPTAEKDRSILVLLQLAGGNDGLNTIVPYADDRYYNLRPNLGLPVKELFALNDHLGLHPECGAMHELFKEGRLSVLQNVGYPNPNRSHFRSMDIWESADDRSGGADSGWIGRYFDNSCSGTPAESNDPVSIFDGAEFPTTLQSQGSHSTLSLPNPGRRRDHNSRLMQMLAADDHHEENDPTHYLRHSLMNTLIHEQRVIRQLQNYRTPVDYPSTSLAQSLKQVAALIAAGLETRVYYVTLGGFDTHANQLNRHAALMRELSGALLAFDRDLRHHRMDDQVVTMTFSEFGRRPTENHGGGTDHGTAAPLFVMGSKVKGGLHGTAPNLNVTANGDLDYNTDFRQVYATILQRWFQCDPKAILGANYPPLDFLG
jgi:uncharacterized protein (DUF1501 family)